LAAGRTSGRALVERSLERIERADGVVNAVIKLDPEGALRAADRMGEADTHGPLLGLPLLVKETEDAIGFATTHGSMLFRDTPPAFRDSSSVAAFRAAGSVVLGKTNCSEFAWEGHSWNRLFGATLNPWDVRRSPGGSSGGSAAALAAGMVPLATATDAGGSTRTPAAQCGLLGLKPSGGTLSCEGQPGELDQLTTGLLAGHPSDLRLVHAALLTGGSSPTRPRVERIGVERIELRRRLVGEAALDDAVGIMLAAVSAQLQELAARLGVVFSVVDAPVFVEVTPDDDALANLALDLMSFLGRRTIADHEDVLDPSIVCGIRGVENLSLDDYLALRRRRLAYRDRLDAALESTLIVTPTLTVEGLYADGTAVNHGSAMLLPQSTTNTNIHNWTGHPALSLPAGEFPSGLPFGIQMTVSRFGDETLLDLADAWYEMFPWPLVARGYEPYWAPDD